MSTVDRLTSNPLWHNSPDGLVIVDESTTMRAVNDPLLELLGYPDRSELVGAPVSVLVPEGFRGVHEHHVDRFLTEPRRRPMADGKTLQARRRDGTTVPVMISLAPLPLAEPPLVVAAVRDATDRIMADSQLVEATRRRLRVEQGERLARELHDTVVQELFALGMALRAVQPEADGEVALRLDRAVDTIDHVIGSIRDLALEVRSRRSPRALTERLVAVAADITPALGFGPRLRMVGPLDDLPAGLADHVVAVVRESLSNAARHAGAVDVDVEVVTDGAVVEVCVADDGHGIPPEFERLSGLANLADRAVELGGSLELAPNDPSGTRLVWRARVPEAGDTGGSEPRIR